MSRSIVAALVVAAGIPLAQPAKAQSVSREETRTTTTTTRDGETTRTTTRTTKVGGEVSVDADRLADALVGALGGGASSSAPEWRRRAEPVRPEDVYGDWLADDGGRDVGDCLYNFRDRAFLGVRGVGAQNCPSRLGRVSNWRVENGELVLYRGATDQLGERLALVEGRLLSEGGLTLRRIADDGPGPVADDRSPRDDRGRGGGAPASEDYAGTWRHVETSSTGHRRECALRLTTNPAFGAMQGSTSGCFGDLMFVNSWRLEDRQVVLYKAGGGTVAILRGGGSRLSGRTPGGAEVVLYR